MEENTTQNYPSYGKRPLWQWVVIYLIIAVILYGAFYYFFLYKKNAGYSITNQAPQATSTPVMSKEITINLDTENSSGEKGTATLKEENGKTTVTINLTGFIKDVPQPAHIHAGNCPGVGEVKYPLTNVLNGESLTTLNVTLDQLRKELPLAINVHKSAQAITSYTSCGEITSTTPSS